MQPMVEVPSSDHSGWSSSSVLPLHVQHQKAFFRAGREQPRLEGSCLEQQCPCAGTAGNTDRTGVKGRGCLGTRKQGVTGAVPRSGPGELQSRSNISRSRSSAGLALLTVTCRTQVGPGQPGARHQPEASPLGLPVWAEVGLGLRVGLCVGRRAGKEPLVCAGGERLGMGEQRGRWTVCG